MTKITEGYTDPSLTCKHLCGGGEWRSADRPPEPTTQPNEVWALAFVLPNSYSYLGIQLNRSTNQTYIVDYGNGEQVIKGTTALHVVHYDEINVKPNSQGVKYFYVKYKLLDNANITSLSLNPTGNPRIDYIINFLELYINCPNITLGSNMELGGSTSLALLFPYIEYIRKDAGANPYGSYTFKGMRNLKKLSGFKFKEVGSYFMHRAIFTGKFEDGTTFEKVGDNFLDGGCLTKKLPETVTFNSVGKYFCYGASIHYEFPESATFKQIGTNFLEYAGYGFVLKITNPKNNFINWSSYSATPISGLRLHEATADNLSSLNVSEIPLNRIALIDLFGDLPNRATLTAGTININKTPGASELTAEDKAIATSKNRNISG